MGIKRVKELFYGAINDKVVFESDARHSIKLLREADLLAKELKDDVWQFIPAYRLAHFLFRGAKNASDLKEIMALVERSESSKSTYIKLQSKFLKFAAQHRLIRLGFENYETEIIFTQDQIIECLKQKRLIDSEISYLRESPNQPLQGSFLNTFEYMVYMAGIDYQPLIGIDYDNSNTLLPLNSNDVWHIVGPDGFVDNFAYNFELGNLELKRIVDEFDADGCYILGPTSAGNYLTSPNKSEKLDNIGLLKILNKIIQSQRRGALTEDLRKEVAPDNHETASDTGSREKPGESRAGQHRRDIENFFEGKRVFEQKTRGRTGASWALAKGIKIYGLVNQKHC